MIPTQIIAFLDMKIDSKAMTISLPEEKIQKIKVKCLELYQNHHVSILELTKILGNITAADSSPEPKGVVPRKHSSKQIQSRNSYGGFRIWRSVTAIPSKSTNTGLLQTTASVAGWEVLGEEVALKFGNF